MQSNPDQIAELSAVNALIERGLLTTVFEETSCQIFAFDAHSHCLIAANKAAQIATGMGMRTLQKRKITDMVQRISPRRINQFLTCLHRRHNQSALVQCQIKDGSSEKAEMRLHYIAAHQDSILVLVKDTAHVSAAIELAHLAEDRLYTAIEALDDGFILFDADDRLVMCNDRYREIYRESAPALVRGAKLEDILRYGLSHDQFMIGFGTEDEWVQRQIVGLRDQATPREQRLSDGRWLRIVERQTADGGRVGLRIDITHLKEQQDELRRLSCTDELTGLLNRRGLARRTEVLAAGISGNTRLAIMHIDLDRFKSVNDVQGHDAGDFVLQNCAQILVSGRPPPHAVARVGGDEFILIKRTDKSDETIIRYARKLIHQLSEPVIFRSQSCHIGASIGLSFVKEDSAEDFANILTAADIALNQAKRLGGNEVLQFQPEMRAKTIQQSEMAREIKKGIENNEFTPFFQPQIDTETNAILGFEALIRWHHPTMGIVPAFQFLPVAQRAGLTDALDDVVMDRACAALKDIREWGVLNPCVSINLSMAQISDPRVVSRLQGHMKRYDVSATNLRIELLESTLLDDRSSLIVQNVHALIAAGFLVELDDFGTGHAAIATLRKFAVSRIKVDRSLVQDIDSDAELQVITAAVIDLAKRLGIDALAEGVETNPEQAMLQKMGCYYAQGYLHAPPMALRDIRPWLQARGEIAIPDAGIENV